MLHLLIVLVCWMAGTSPAPPEGCRTVFYVTSCGNKPVKGASITLHTGWRKKVSGKTDKNGQVNFNFCLLNFDIPGEPMIHLSSGDSAYVYQAYQEGKVRRMYDTLEIQRRSTYPSVYQLLQLRNAMGG